MLKLKNICKTYSTKDGVTHRALNNISLEFEEKGLVFVLGKSGSGKSTLLNIIGGLDSFDRGEIYLYGKKFSSFKAFDYDFYRNTFTGFVFQEFNLINELTIEENVTLSLDLQSKKDKERINQIFEELEISELKNRKTFELSGGQKQRVAIARALVKNPSIILADEPTGSLDTKTTKDIIDLLVKLSKERLVIVITHNRDLAEQYGDRVIELKDGEILKDLSTQKNLDNEKYASLIASSILKIPPYAKIRKEDINKMNAVLANEKIDHFISFETNQNKVKSMFPHLKEAINTDNEEEKEKFKQYVYKEEEEKDVKLIKSHLPFKRGLKFGASNLKIKVPKLIFTVLLATLAITISGCVDNFANYDQNKAIANAIYENDLSYIKIESAYSSFSNYSLKNKDIEKINYMNNGEAPLIYRDTIRITNYELNWNFVPMNSLNEFVETDNIEDYGYEYLAKSNENYDEHNGVIISELVAREIAYTYGKEAIDVLDKEIHLDNRVCYVKGIFKNEDLGKYDLLRKQYSYMDLELIGEYNDLYNRELSQVFVDYGFIDYYKENTNSITEYELSLEFDDNSGFFSGNTLHRLKENHNIVTLSNQKGVYLSRASLESQMYMAGYSNVFDYVNYLNSIDMTLQVANSVTDSVCYISNQYKIKGYYEGVLSGIILDEELFNTINDFIVQPTGALINIQGFNKSKVIKLVETIYNNGFIVDESFVSDYYDLVEVFSLIEQLLSGINTLVFILAIILLFSFMLSSIRNNTRQIGILRAIGANILDVIKIYVIEALIIGAISLTISLLIYGIGGVIVNHSIAGYMSIFTFGSSTVFKMASSTLIVVFLSLIIPIIKVTKMHPVDAIRGDK